MIAVVDGLTGLPEAMTAALPEALVATRIARLIRHVRNFSSGKDRNALAADLHPVSEAPTAGEWPGHRMISKRNGPGNSPRSPQPSAREDVTPFKAFGAAIRTITHTTEANKPRNRRCRKDGLPDWFLILLSA